MKSDQNFDAWLIQCHRMTRRLWVSHCAWSRDLNSRKGVLPGRQLFANWETVTPPSSCCTLSPYYGVHRPCCCTRLRAFSKWPIWSPCTWCIAHWAPDWLHPVASLCLSRRRFQLGLLEDQNKAKLGQVLRQIFSWGIRLCGCMFAKISFITSCFDEWSILKTCLLSACALPLSGLLTVWTLGWIWCVISPTHQHHLITLRKREKEWASFHLSARCEVDMIGKKWSGRERH